MRAQLSSEEERFKRQVELLLAENQSLCDDLMNAEAQMGNAYPISTAPHTNPNSTCLSYIPLYLLLCVMLTLIQYHYPFLHTTHIFPRTVMHDGILYAPIVVVVVVIVVVVVAGNSSPSSLARKRSNHDDLTGDGDGGEYDANS